MPVLDLLSLRIIVLTWIKKFKRNEIFQAASSMHPFKASGSDRMDALIYQRYWDVVWEDVSSIYHKFLNNGVSLEGSNHTLLA